MLALGIIPGTEDQMAMWTHKYVGARDAISRDYVRVPSLGPGALVPPALF